MPIRKLKNVLCFRHRIRLLPNAQMKKELDRCMDYDRYCWNMLLEMKNECDKTKDYSRDLLKEMRAIRNNSEWQLEMPEYILAQCYNWFTKSSIQVVKHNIDVKQYNATHTDKKDYHHLHFKDKKSDKYSFQVPNDRHLVGTFEPKGKNYKFSIKLGSKCKVDPKYRMMEIAELPKGISDGSTRVLSMTILKKYGEYFVSFCLEVLKPKQFFSKNGVLGIDPGIKSALTLSTGRKCNIPEKLKALHKKKKFYKSRLDKRFKKGSIVQSKRYYRARAKFVSILKAIYNLKRDWMHKLTTMISKKYNEIHFEHCETTGMRKIAYQKETLENSSWGTFEMWIEYKCKKRNGRFYSVNSTRAATQTCSNCGNVLKNENKLKLKDRIYTCPICNFVCDRDINAAKSLAKMY